MACAGFILTGAEKNLRGGRKKIRGENFLPPLFSFLPPPAEFDYAPPAEFDFAPPAEFNSAPPAEFDSTPGAELTRGGGGQKTLLYLEKEGETFDNRSLSKPQLTVLFF